MVKLNDKNIIGTVCFLAAVPFIGRRPFPILANLEIVNQVNSMLYIGNLPKSITRQQLTALFSLAGDVALVDMITDRKSGEAKGFAFVTMGTQSEAEKAIHMFNAYSLNKQEIKVNMAKFSYYL